MITRMVSRKDHKRRKISEKIFTETQNVILFEFFMTLLENYHYHRAPHCEQQRSADRLATSRPLLFISLT